MTTFTGHLTDAQAQRLVDGALLPEEGREVEGHARSCPECEALVFSYRVLGEALGDLEVPELAADFTRGVLDRIAGEERVAARERRHAFAIVAVVLAAIAGVAVLAGAGVLAPVFGRAALDAGSAARALQVGAHIATPIVSAIRLPLALASALATLPILFALSRLMSGPRTEIA
ncbi:MAG TPA: anti-sigma factor [Anaeromyxobacter sp.]|nr:anti-sigma factor [Anaeromyxobacter sp.]